METEKNTEETTTDIIKQQDENGLCRNSKIVKIKRLIIGGIPIIIGGLIYLTYRTDTLLMFSWFNKLGLSNLINFLRSNESLQALIIPDWVKYSLPDALWLFSFAYILLVLWDFKVSRQSVFWLLLVPVIGLFSEIGQLIGVVPGTFDIVDLFLLLVTLILSFFLINNKQQILMKTKKMTTHLFSTLAVCFFIFIAFGSDDDTGSTSSSSSSSSSSTGKDGFLAYTYAERYVKKQLKSPSTAKFPGSFEKNEHITYMGNNRYQIISWVDSQNSFGATIRSNFMCVVKIENDTVYVEELEIY